MCLLIYKYKDLSSSVPTSLPILIHLHVYFFIFNDRSNTESLEGTNTWDPPIDFKQETSQTEDEENEDVGLPPELERLVAHKEQEMGPHQEETKLVDLGTGSGKKEVKIGTSMTTPIREELTALLKDYQDIFAWSYQDMPGLSFDIVQHRLPLNPECSPIKQKLRRMKPETSFKIKEEVKKQFDAGFLAAARYPEWVANIVPVPKKDGKVRMCVDYRDLNQASPKDNFPLPHIDILVDNTTNFALFSFIDGFSGYNQIRMASEDMEKTTFVTLWGCSATR